MIRWNDSLEQAMGKLAAAILIGVVAFALMKLVALFVGVLGGGMEP